MRCRMFVVRSGGNSTGMLTWALESDEQGQLAALPHARQDAHTADTHRCSPSPPRLAPIPPRAAVRRVPPSHWGASSEPAVDHKQPDRGALPFAAVESSERRLPGLLCDAEGREDIRGGKRTPRG